MSRDILVGVILGAGATLAVVGVAAVYFAYTIYKRLHQGQINGQRAEYELFEAECTCDERHSKCEKHDEILLIKISKIVPSYGDMTYFGSVLDIKREVIDSCYENNKSCINTAVLKMLQKWYDRKPEFKVNSEAIAKLKDALEAIGLVVKGAEIINKHFGNR